MMASNLLHKRGRKEAEGMSFKDYNQDRHKEGGQATLFNNFNGYLAMGQRFTVRSNRHMKTSLSPYSVLTEALAVCWETIKYGSYGAWGLKQPPATRS